MNYKKLIIKLIIVTLFVIPLVIFIKNNTTNYDKRVTENLTKYIGSLDKKYLQNIGDIYDKVGEEELFDLQTISYKYVSNLISGLDGKYNCDLDNINSCVEKKQDLDYINQVVTTISAYKSKKGNYIIDSVDYNSFSETYKTLSEKLDKLINSPLGRSPKDEVELNRLRCSVAYGCDTRCNKGVCECYYDNSEGIKTKIYCKNMN